MLGVMVLSLISHSLSLSVVYNVTCELLYQSVTYTKYSIYSGIFAKKEVLFYIWWIFFFLLFFFIVFILIFFFFREKIFENHFLIVFPLKFYIWNPLFIITTKERQLLHMWRKLPHAHNGNTSRITIPFLKQKKPNLLGMQ